MAELNKKCTRCSTDIDYSNNIRKRSRKFCSVTCRVSDYTENNRDRVKKYKKQYYLNNIEQNKERNRTNYYSKYRKKQEFSECPCCFVDFLKSRADQRFCSKQCADKHFRKNKDINAWYRDYYHSCLDRKLASCIRSRLSKALKGAGKESSFKEYVGCSIEELKAHLESKFQPGMTWENYGKDGWHIDHIKPLASFDLTDPLEFRYASHYANLQPLWAEDNLKKGSRL